MFNKILPYFHSFKVDASSISTEFRSPLDGPKPPATTIFMTPAESSYAAQEWKYLASFNVGPFLTSKLFVGSAIQTLFDISPSCLPPI